MTQKLIVPIAAVALAVLAGIAIWFLMDDSTPAPIVAGNEAGSPIDPKTYSPPPLSATDFDPASLQPDPVVIERPDQPFEAPEETMRIIVSGRVITNDGVGVADARVLVVGGGGGRLIPRQSDRNRGLHGSGYTDASGFYRLLAWSNGSAGGSQRRAMVAAETPDGGIAIAESVELPEEPTFEMADLVVTAGRVIEGQVFGADGQPAPGAEVTLRSSGPVMVASLSGRTPSAHERPLVRTVIADQRGNYRAANLPQGRYGVEAFGAYFGATTGRTVVDVVDVPSAWHEIRLVADNMIRGVLTDQSGVGVAGAVMRLTGGSNAASNASDISDFRRSDDREDLSLRARDTIKARFPEGRLGSRMHCITDSAGRFGFLNPGAGEFTIVTRVGNTELREEGVTVSPSDYSLQIDVGTIVGGLVRDAETSRVIERFDARLLPGTGSTANSPFEGVAENGRFEFHPGGAYAFSNPPTGAVRVRVCAPGYAPTVVIVESLSEGDQRRDLDIMLKPLCEVSARLVRGGRALDLEPCALLFDDRLAYEASSDELGRVRIPGVTPQTYRVKVVLADGTELEGSVEVPARRQADLEIVVEPAK
ncbi:MAG: carboxypeptidase-like regulatory domain-containing protein [Planctomycetota bacterium]